MNDNRKNSFGTKTMLIALVVLFLTGLVTWKQGESGKAPNVDLSAPEQAEETLPLPPAPSDAVSPDSLEAELTRLRQENQALRSQHAELEALRQQNNVLTQALAKVQLDLQRAQEAPTAEGTSLATGLSEAPRTSKERKTLGPAWLGTWMHSEPVGSSLNGWGPPPVLVIRGDGMPTSVQWRAGDRAMELPLEPMADFTTPSPLSIIGLARWTSPTSTNFLVLTLEGERLRAEFVQSFVRQNDSSLARQRRAFLFTRVSY